MQVDATGDDYGDPDLFSISVIKVSCLFLWSCYVLYVYLVALPALRIYTNSSLEEL